MPLRSTSPFASRFRAFSLALCATLALGATAARAVDEPALLKEVPKLIRDGKLDDAERIVNSVLAANPTHPAARFQKSIVLTERGKTDEAIGLLQELSGEYPELPEPYNNLAVLYAAKGRYDDARWALVMAQKAEPDYPLADENLGDVYAKLADLEYEKAAKKDPGNQVVRTKRNTIQGLVAPAKPSSSLKEPAASTSKPEPVKPSSR